MFRSPWELEVHVRHQNQRLADERQSCSPIDRAGAESPRLLTQLRRRLGIGLIRAGTIMADADALRGLPTTSAWPNLANR